MGKDFTNTFILNSLGLPIIKDLESLSNQMGISKKLIYLLSNKTEHYYKEFSIPKKDGSPRVILSPSYSLKIVQRWILEEILKKISVTKEATAYISGQGSGIKRNAEYHKYNLFILQLDIKDFFTSIKKDEVFYVFKNLGYNNYISNILSELCTYQGFLPQGGVCSPYLSNLVCYKLDKRITGLCSKRDIIYTRYADDLTLSCNYMVDLKKIRIVIEEICTSEGFEINQKKTRFLSPQSHKKVTGLTVNDNKVKASKELKKVIRAAINNSITTGDYSKRDQILGRISFVNSIEEGYKQKVISYIEKLVTKEFIINNSYLVNEYNKNLFFKEMKPISIDVLGS